MIKILLGGSPCTFWSIIQKNRETEPSGLGWELFKNFLIAKEKFKPDIFLYENNKSAAEPIKQQIRKELGVGNGAIYSEFNSALVSAQNRRRFYVHNCGEVAPLQDKGVRIDDIIEPFDEHQGESLNIGGCKTIQKALPKLAKKLGYVPQHFNAYNLAELKDKAPTLSTGSMATSSCAVNRFERVSEDSTLAPLFCVRGGELVISGIKYPAKFPDGTYIIRKLNVTECERLQTLPVGYCRSVSAAQGYKAIGDGWTADIVIHILGGALKDIPKDEPIVVLSMYDGIATGRYCLEKMGFTNITYFSYEIDDYKKDIAMSNYPNILQCGDAFQLRTNTAKRSRRKV